MTNGRFPNTVPRLSGAGLILRALDESDIPDWFSRATDRASAELAGDPVPETMAEGAAWLARHRARFSRGEGVQWAITRDGGPGSIGSLGLRLSADAPRAASLGFVIGRAEWGQGVATSAARLAVDYGLTVLGLTRIEAEAVAHNTGSRRVLAKLGFHEEGRFLDDGETCLRFALTA